ncbi:hypothetical protein M3J09_012706 [Ascochyta lentis]
MLRVPGSTILCRPEPEHSDVSVSGSVRTPSDSSDAEDTDSLLEVKAILKKRDELEREYRERLSARRAKSIDRRRTKHKWSSVKVTPSEKSADEQVQIQAADTTSQTWQKKKTWAQLLRDKQLEQQREMAAQYTVTAGHSGQNMHAGQKFSMTQNASRDSRKQVGAAYVDSRHTSDPLSQSSNAHVTSPAPQPGSWAFYHATRTTKTDQGSPLLPHLRRYITKSSKPEASLTTNDQAVAASIAQREQKNRSVEGLTHAPRTGEAKVFAKRVLEREEANVLQLDSKNKQRESWGKPVSRTTIRSTSSPEVVSNTTNAITAKQSEPRRPYNKNKSKAPHKFSGATATKPQDVDGAHFGLTQPRIRQLQLQREGEFCNEDGFASIDTPAAEVDLPLDIIKDESAWTFDNISNLSAGADDSEDLSVDASTSNSYNGDDLAQRILEDFPEDHSTLSRNSTSTTFASRLDGQKACRSCSPSLHQPGSSKTENESLGAKGHQAEDSETMNCHHCSITFDSQPSVAHCPGCGQSSELYIHDAGGLGVAEEAVPTVLESAIAEERAPEYPTSRNSRKPSPDHPRQTLEHAWELLELQRYKSVDLNTLQNCLNRVMAQDSDYSRAADAFAAVVKHQDENGCWNLRLRWTDDDDMELQGYVVDGQLEDYSSLVWELETSEEDCLLRWEQIKPQVELLAKTSTPSTASTANEPPEATYPDGWDAELDEKLLNLRTNGQDFSTIAIELKESTAACENRFRQIRPKNWIAKPYGKIQKDASKTPWTPRLDHALMRMKDNSDTWSEIYEVLGIPIDECKARFEEIASKDWKPQSTKDSEKSTVKLPTPSVGEDGIEDGLAVTQYAGSRAAPDNTHIDGTAGGFNGIDVPSNTDENEHTVQVRDCRCKVGTCCYCSHSSSDAAKFAEFPDTATGDSKKRVCMLHDWIQDYCGCEPSANDDIDVASKDAQDAVDQGNAADHSLGLDPCQTCGGPEDSCQCDYRTPTPSLLGYNCTPWDPCTCREPASLYPGGWGSATSDPPQPQPASHPSYTVTYWATIESGGKEIRVPIDSKNVCGPEKTVVDVGMQKVWKWIHDKGLNDKVGLQDAFDLAQAMQEEGYVEKVKTAQVGRKAVSVTESVRSCGSDRQGFWGW